MRPAVFAVATLACLIGAPCFAGPAPAVADRPVTLAQIDVQVGRDRDYDRDRWREHHREGCRDVTIRERHGGDVVVRHIRRCDRD